MTCKDVARELTGDLLTGAGVWHRARVRLHLWMCRHCARLERQINRIGEAGRLKSRAIDREKPSEGADSLEARIARRLLDD